MKKKYEISAEKIIAKIEVPNLSSTRLSIGNVPEIFVDSNYFSISTVYDSRGRILPGVMIMTKNELNNMLSKMIVFATNGHAGQFDRGGNPYILHVLAVMQLVNSGDIEIKCMAVGHDLFEDTKITAQELRDAGISERIINGIFCLTKMPGQSYEEYKSRVFSNSDSMVVKMADLTHNSDIRRLKGVSEKDIDRMVKYHRFYLEIQEKLNESVGMNGD